MDRSSPQSTFAAAQQAMQRGDWEVFFACLAAKDLKRIAAIGMLCVDGDGAAAFVELAIAHGVPADDVDRVRRTGEDIVVSAATILAADPLPSPATLELSLRHRDLVKARDATIDDCVKRVADLAAFAAAVERHRRTISGGGTISSTMFVDETLVDVVITDSKAVGIRRRRGGGDERIGFVRQRSGWSIVLFGRP